MTEVMQLDMESDEGGLLVGFNDNQSPSASSLYAETKSPRRGLGRFFSSQRESSSFLDSSIDSPNNTTTPTSRRSGKTSLWGLNRNNNKQQQEEEKKEKARNSDRKATTFAFPNAHVVHADMFMEPEEESKKPEEKPKEDENDGEESDDEEESDAEEEASGEEEESEDEESDDEDDDEDEARDSPKDLLDTEKKEQASSPEENWDDEDYTSRNKLYDENGFKRNLAKEAYGSNDNIENKRGFFGRLFGGRRAGDQLSEPERREMEREKARKEKASMQTMKVATEDTKDDMTFTEQLTRAALIVMVPEVYADDEDGEDNLGQYRSVALTDGSGHKARVRGAPEFTQSPSLDTTRLYKMKITTLEKKVAQLQKDLKSSELEATSWKLRAKELERMLRRERGQNDDDSSAPGGMSGDDDEDDGIEKLDGDLLNMEPPLTEVTTTAPRAEHLNNENSVPVSLTPTPPTKSTFDPMETARASEAGVDDTDILDLDAPTSKLELPPEKNLMDLSTDPSVVETPSSEHFVPYVKSPTSREHKSSEDGGPTVEQNVAIDLSGINQQQLQQKLPHPIVTTSRDVSIGSSNGSAFEPPSPAGASTQSGSLSPTAPPPPCPPPPLPPMEDGSNHTDDVTFSHVAISSSHNAEEDQLSNEVEAINKAAEDSEPFKNITLSSGSEAEEEKEQEGETEEDDQVKVQDNERNLDDVPQDGVQEEGEDETIKEVKSIDEKKEAIEATPEHGDLNNSSDFCVMGDSTPIVNEDVSSEPINDVPTTTGSDQDGDGDAVVSEEEVEDQETQGEMKGENGPRPET